MITIPEEVTTPGDNGNKTIRIPQNVWHAYRVLGTQTATIRKFHSTLYTYDDPDVEYLQPDTEEIPHEWV